MESKPKKDGGRQQESDDQLLLAPLATRQLENGSVKSGRKKVHNTIVSVKVGKVPARGRAMVYHSVRYIWPFDAALSLW
jgi:hypothetical protein